MYPNKNLGNEPWVGPLFHPALHIRIQGRLGLTTRTQEEFWRLPHTILNIKMVVQSLAPHFSHPPHSLLAGHPQLGVTLFSTPPLPGVLGNPRTIFPPSAKATRAVFLREVETKRLNSEVQEKLS